jgi:hypothetical protein
LNDLAITKSESAGFDAACFDLNGMCFSGGELQRILKKRRVLTPRRPYTHNRLEIVRDGAHHPIGGNSIPSVPRVNEKDFASSLVNRDEWAAPTS